jgi:hypothetical protein
MDEQGIKEWWAKRVPFSGRLSDYAMLVGQNNRAQQSKSFQTVSAATITFGPDPNRIAVLAAAIIAGTTTAMDCEVRARNLQGVVTFNHQLVWKEADVALVTPSPILYVPLMIDILKMGPDLQSTWELQGSTGVVATLTFITFNPKCCDYIGGM